MDDLSKFCMHAVCQNGFKDSWQVGFACTESLSQVRELITKQTIEADHSEVEILSQLNEMRALLYILSRLQGDYKSDDYESFMTLPEIANIKANIESRGSIDPFAVMNTEKADIKRLLEIESILRNSLKYLT